MVKNLTAMQEIRLQSLGWEDLLQKGIGIHSNTLTGEFYGQRSLAGYSPWGPKESEMTGPFTLLIPYSSQGHSRFSITEASRLLSLAL